MDAGWVLGKDLVHGEFFDGNIADRVFFLIGAKRHQRDAGPNWGEMKDIGRVVRFTPVRGDDGHDRSFITRDFNRV